MSSHQEDLDLLLSLQDRVVETPPGSPSNHRSRSPGYLSDDGSPRKRRHADLSMFRDAVEDCMDYQPKQAEKVGKSKGSKSSNEPGVEKYSGLRIRNQLVTPSELNERFSDIRFVRLPTIKNLLVGDSISGCWVTVGVLTDKGAPRTTSTGKSYGIWKLGCLDENTVSVFLFGDAYQQNCKEQAGTVFALFNCEVRKDNGGSGFSLSVKSSKQILKMGSSVDYGVCKGKRKDGMACTLAINKRQGMYCRYHNSKSAETYSTMRSELKGGNLKTAFWNPLRARGIYIVDPLADRTNSKASKQPVKLLSVDSLKRALSKADKVTTNPHSQGIRCLNHVTVAGKPNPKSTSKASAASKPQMTTAEKRKSSITKTDPSVLIKNQSDTKRTKVEHAHSSAEKLKPGTGKMIELDIISSDDEL